MRGVTNNHWAQLQGQFQQYCKNYRIKTQSALSQTKPIIKFDVMGCLKEMVCGEYTIHCIPNEEVLILLKAYKDQQPYTKTNAFDCLEIKGILEEA